ncbi:MAG TPA: peptidylprolyl isomerase [Planctomycetota bacterium]|nr:peptidylprolyl isomerase [Planctomycetota bacterium]
MRTVAIAVALILGAGPSFAQEAAKSDLAVTLVADKAEYVLGDDILAEVTLANSGEKAVELAELTFDERSLSFDVTFDAGGGKTKQFLFSIVRPDPHLMERVGPSRISLKSKKSLVGVFRIPTLRAGAMTVTAVYRGGDKEVKSAVASLKVGAQKNDKGEDQGRLAAIVETSMGSLQIDLAPEDAPNNVANFVALSRRGFYNGLIFHRVVKNSWIQSGCPYDNGYGGPGYALKSEAEGQKVPHEAGTVSLSGNLKNGYTGSQFFIALTNLPSFDGKFTVIGKVTPAGIDAVRKIGLVEVDKNTDRPSKEDVRLKEVKIVAIK